MSVTTELVELLGKFVEDAQAAGLRAEGATARNQLRRLRRHVLELELAARLPTTREELARLILIEVLAGGHAFVAAPGRELRGRLVDDLERRAQEENVTGLEVRRGYVRAEYPPSGGRVDYLSSDADVARGIRLTLGVVLWPDRAQHGRGDHLVDTFADGARHTGGRILVIRDMA